jgi:hypothetical protein
MDESDGQKTDKHIYSENTTTLLFIGQEGNCFTLKKIEVIIVRTEFTAFISNLAVSLCSEITMLKYPERKMSPQKCKCSQLFISVDSTSMDLINCGSKILGKKRVVFLLNTKIFLFSIP